MATQLHLALISHEVESSIIPQRAVDGYVNATAMCQACGKNFADYNRLASTAAFLDELSSDMGIPISALIAAIKGGNPAAHRTGIRDRMTMRCI